MYFARMFMFTCLIGVTPFSILSAETAQEDVLLTVTHASDAESSVSFDMAGLKALESTTFETTTIWTEGVQTFTGVPLSTLLADLEIADGTIFASAINDYTVEIPVSDAVENGPIIAYELNGQEMSIRDKGPLWVVYPYDRTSAYRTEVIYSRSIWQLDRIRIEQ